MKEAVLHQPNLNVVSPHLDVAGLFGTQSRFDRALKREAPKPAFEEIYFRRVTYFPEVKGEERRVFATYLNRIDSTGRVTVLGQIGEEEIREHSYNQDWSRNRLHQGVLATDPAEWEETDGSQWKTRITDFTVIGSSSPLAKSYGESAATLAKEFEEKRAKSVLTDDYGSVIARPESEVPVEAKKPEINPKDDQVDLVKTRSELSGLYARLAGLQENIDSTHAYNHTIFENNEVLSKKWDRKLIDLETEIKDREKKSDAEADAEIAKKTAADSGVQDSSLRPTSVVPKDVFVSDVPPLRESVAAIAVVFRDKGRVIANVESLRREAGFMKGADVSKAEQAGKDSRNKLRSRINAALPIAIFKTSETRKAEAARKVAQSTTPVEVVSAPASTVSEPAAEVPVEQAVVVSPTAEHDDKNKIKIITKKNGQKVYMKDGKFVREDGTFTPASEKLKPKTNGREAGGSIDIQIITPNGKIRVVTKREINRRQERKIRELVGNGTDPDDVIEQRIVELTGIETDVVKPVEPAAA